MKPINADNPGCDPISSNCVIWQGPDLGCIGLCKGDSVSQVVYKLAKEICSILDTLNIESYDIECLNVGGCDPVDFKALIQVLINKICDLENIDTTTTITTDTDKNGGDRGQFPIKTRVLSGDNVPDAVMATPEEFWYKNSLGDTVKEQQIFDVAYTAANKINTIVGEISTIDRTLGNHEERIQVIESQPVPTLNLPNLSPVCVSAEPLLPLDELTRLLETDFCELKSATGAPIEIYEALSKQLAGLNQMPQLANKGSFMEALPGWKDEVTNLADSYSNMLLTLADIRAAVLSMQLIVTGTDCDALDVVLSASLNNPNELKVHLSGTTPTGFTETPAAGSIMTITDASGNTINVTIPVTSNLNEAVGFTVQLASTPINSNSNLIVSIALDFTDGESQCQKVIQDTVLAIGNCPILTLIPTTTDITYSATYMGDAASIAVNLYANDGTTLLQSQVTVVTGPQTLNNVFAGLLENTQYKVRLEITPDGAPTTTLCPFSGAVTLQNSCIPPVNLEGTLIIL